MQPYHVFFAKNGSNVHGNHGPRIVQVVPQQHHIAHVFQHHSSLLQQQVSSDSPGLNEVWSKLHLAKVLEKAKE